MEQQQELQEKSRLMLEQKLQSQQKQSEEDARWLRSKEENMVGVSMKSKMWKGVQHGRVDVYNFGFCTSYLSSLVITGNNVVNIKLVKNTHIPSCDVAQQRFLHNKLRFYVTKS